MRILSIVGTIGLMGCITKNVSTVGPFVHEIQADPQGPGLVIDSCEVREETTYNYAWLWLGQNVSRDRALLDGQCTRTVVPTGGA